MSATIIYQASSVSIPKGAFTSPSLALPANLTTQEVDVSISAENWPAAGVDVALQASVDGGATYQNVFGPQTIMKPLTDKNGVLPPVRVGYSWGAGDRPDHIRATTNSSLRFTAADLEIVSPE